MALGDKYIVEYKYKGGKYRTTFESYASHSSQVLGCHSLSVQGLGTFGAVRTEKETDKGWEPVNGMTDNWGRPVESPAKIVRERFHDCPEDVYDKLYPKVLAAYSHAGVVIFSDHVNAGCSERQMQDAGVPNGPAPLAIWLHKNKDRFGPIFGSPVFGNPNHKTKGTYSLVQVFTWIPKANAWTVSCDLSKVPLTDSEFSSEKFFSNPKLLSSLRITDPNEAKEALKVTYGG